MAKVALTLQNLQDGNFLDQINEQIAVANLAVGASNDAKAKAEIVVKIVIESGDADDCFRKITPSIAVKAPPLPKKSTIYPVAIINGKRVIAVDPTQDGEQMKMPGVTPIRAAS
jgi:hypothetical protein